MPFLRRCVAIINNRSGWCKSDGVERYTSTLKTYLDRAGIVHQDIYIPNDDVASALWHALPHAEALVLCGGDGTVNSVVNLLAAMAPPRAAVHDAAGLSCLETVPLLLVPTGVHNSIATSLGVTSAERAVSSLVIGRTVRVPLWAVHLHRSHIPMGLPPLRYMCSYVATGTYAAAVERQGRWKEARAEYVSLPSVLGGFAASALYSTFEYAMPRCTAEMKLDSRPSADCAASSVRTGPLRLLVASQMPHLQPGYSLTPAATYHQHTLSVLTATAEATRLRLWHLLRREAREGYILMEDGVSLQESVHSLQVDFPRMPCKGLNNSSLTDPPQDAWAHNDKEREEEDSSQLLVVDGECVHVPTGSSVVVTPTEKFVQLVAP